MPPEEYTTVTISDGLAVKLTRTMARHDRSSYAAAIKYITDTTLVRENELTIRELV